MAKLKFSKEFLDASDKIFVNRIKENRKKELFNKAMLEGWSYSKFKKILKQRR